MLPMFLLALLIGKRLCISAGLGFGDKILVQSLTNVKMTSVHKMKFSHGYNFTCLGGCNLKYRLRFLLGTPTLA
jgi:hypothetical protein